MAGSQYASIVFTEATSPGNPLRTGLPRALDTVGYPTMDWIERVYNRRRRFLGLSRPVA